MILSEGSFNLKRAKALYSTYCDQLTEIHLL